MPVQSEPGRVASVSAADDPSEAAFMATPFDARTDRAFGQGTLPGRAPVFFLPGRRCRAGNGCRRTARTRRVRTCVNVPKAKAETSLERVPAFF